MPRDAIDAAGALRGFAAGFVATLAFHQSVLALLHAAGRTPRRPWDMSPTPPFGVPAVLSLAFFGGLWGVALWLLLRRSSHYWTTALAFGALAPSAVALFIVFPLKHQPVAGGWDPAILVGALLLNGAWGLGVGLFLRALGGPR